MTFQKKLLLKTKNNGDMCDLTEKVREIVRESGVRTGMVNVFNIGSTGAIGTIEFEPGLQQDFPEMLNRLIPASDDYGHQHQWEDGNGHSHLQATTLGPDLTIPIAGGRDVAGNLAADLPPGMRYQTKNSRNYRYRLRISLEVQKPASDIEQAVIGDGLQAAEKNRDWRC